eukprot:TRINITY_DN47650_c0_g1_i1.p1 TRINITY_DN47650_c0_g1~~TRINITY_DN47650_c0_g1_i1.p1  ORF type:complete len:153 (+),score=19.71 TRINITY_DN47650_c0_g1_i1:44-460(+)
MHLLHGHHGHHHHHHHHRHHHNGNNALGAVHGGKTLRALPGPSEVGGDTEARHAPQNATDMITASYGVVHIKRDDNDGTCALFTTTGKKIPCKLATKHTFGFDSTIPQQLDINGVAYPARVDEFGMRTMFATSSCVIS